MKKTILASLVAFATLAAPISTQAQLVMTIDTTAKTFALSGSDSGIVENLGVFTWSQAAPGTELPNQSVLVDSTWYSLNPGPILGGSLNTGDNPDRISLSFFSNPGAQTISGLGAPISYAGLSANNQAAFEALIGQNLGLVVSSGFGSISVVPEPHEYAAMAGLGLLGFAGFRRWRQGA